MKKYIYIQLSVCFSICQQNFIVLYRDLAHVLLNIYLVLDGDYPGGLDRKESACNVGDLGLIPGLGRSPGGGHGNPLQYSCLENPMDRGAWWATVHGVTKSWT